MLVSLVYVGASVCMCVCVCVCAIRIVCVDMILCFINTLLLLLFNGQALRKLTDMGEQSDFALYK